MRVIKILISIAQNDSWREIRGVWIIGSKENGPKTATDSRILWPGNLDSNDMATSSSLNID